MKYLLVCLVNLPSLLNAQAILKAIVVNQKNDPLPVTNIVMLNSNNGTITNEAGEFSLAIRNEPDSIKITNIAYYPKVIAIKDLRLTDTIILIENIKQLDAVVIKNLSKYNQQVNLGFDNYSSNGEFKLMPGNQIAVYIANDKNQECWIKSVSFKVKQSGKCKNSMRIRLMQMDTITLSPSFDLLEENIIIQSSNLKKTNNVDVSDYKIMLPKEGLFVMLEWLYPENDCDKNSYTSIASNLVTPNNIVWFNFRDKAWSQRYRPKLPNGNYNTPNIGLQVAYTSFNRIASK